MDNIKFEPNKYIVIKHSDIEKLSKTIKDRLEEILLFIDNKNDYLVLNQDEPYAPRVLNMILEHEKLKEL